MAVLYRGKITSEEISLPFHSPALNWGRAFFETLLYDSGKLFFYPFHLERIRKTCTHFGIFLEMAHVREDLVLSLIRHNREEEKTLRVKILYLNSQDTQWDMAVFSAPCTPSTASLKAGIHPEVRDSSFYRFKSANYFENLYLKERYARELGAEEIFFLNARGNIVEGSYTSVFCVKDRELYCVGSANPCLPGIIAGRLAACWREIGFKDFHTMDQGFPPEFLGAGDEVFVTNSLILAREVNALQFPGKESVPLPSGGWASRVREYFLA